MIECNINEITSTSTSINESINIQNIHNFIDKLIYKYQHEPHILTKLETYINTTLPTHLDTYKQTLKNRAKTKKRDDEVRSELIHKFMTTSNYYYCSVTETYFLYNFITYIVVTEDFVRNHIYCMLTNNNIISSLKYKTMKLILKTVKERNILNAIPESTTIQQVIKLFPEPYILSKNTIKYFLTIIGDCILKKNINMCYFLSTKIKPLMKELSNRCHEYLGCDSISRRFKYKFHEQHSIAECRLIMNLQFSDKCINVLQNRALDLISVATHYSMRYKSGDDFLTAKSYDQELCNYIYFLKNHNSVNSVILDFISQMLEKTNESTTTLTMKNMIFLWKRYCEQVIIPSVVILSQLKHYLTPHLKYDEDTDSFHCVTSPYVPMVSHFLKFWSDCVTPITTDEHYYTLKDNEYIIEIEYEIEEVCHMFKTWSSQKYAMSETLLLKLIKHFFDDQITIQEEKYIYGVKINMWNKPKDVINALAALQTERNQHDSPLSTLYDVYGSYYEKRKNTAIANASSNPNDTSYIGGIVSKRYFEKCIREFFPNSLSKNNDNITLLDWTQLVLSEQL